MQPGTAGQEAGSPASWARPVVSQGLRWRRLPLAEPSARADTCHGGFLPSREYLKVHYGIFQIEKISNKSKWFPYIHDLDSTIMIFLPNFLLSRKADRRG